MKRLIIGFCFLFQIIINANSSDIISDIENNWNQIETMSGKFKQEDSDGTVSHGSFYFLKPYQSKFVYIDKPENIITNESLLVIVDEDNYKLESYSIGDNVLKKILSSRLSISEQFNVINYETIDNQYILELKIKNQESNLISITFEKDTLDIKKWEIYDEFKNRTVLEFTKIKKNIFISQNLFVVKYR